MESSRSSKSKSSSSRPRVCRSCGQHHSHHEPHIYDYPEVSSSNLVTIQSRDFQDVNKDLMSKSENIFSGRGRGLDVPDLPPTLCGTHRHPLLSYFLSGGILVTISPHLFNCLHLTPHSISSCSASRHIWWPPTHCWVHYLADAKCPHHIHPLLAHSLAHSRY